MKNEKVKEHVMNSLRQIGVQSGVHYIPNHFHTYFRSSLNRPLKCTEEIYPKLLTLPLHPDLSERDVRFIAKHTKDFAAGLE